MINRKLAILITLFWISAMPILIAQQTTIYTQPHRSFRQALSWMEEGNYGLAQKIFAEYVAEMDKGHLPNSEVNRVAALYNHALCAKKLKHPDAEMLLAKFIDEQGTNEHTNIAFFELGQLYFAKKKYKDVLVAYSEVDARYLNASQIADYYFQFGYSYFVIKQFNKAKPYFKELSKNFNPYYFDANYYYGIIAFFQKDYRTAINSFKQIEQNRRYAQATPYYITLLHYLRQEYNELLAYATPRVNRNGRYRKEMNHLVGLTYFNLKQFEQALPHLAYYVNNSRQVDKEEIYQLAFTQYKLNKYQDAIQNFSQLNTEENTFGQNALYHLADCYIKTNQKQKAYNAFDAAARMTYDPVIREVATFNKAKLSYDLGLGSQAINALQDFLSIYPRSVYENEAKQLLSSLFETTKNYKDALRILESMPSKSPELWATYQRIVYYRGVEFYKDKLYDNALNMFNRAIDAPSETDERALAHFWKGDIYYKRKSYDQSFNSMEAYLALSGGKTVSEKASPVTANYTNGYNLFKQREYQDALFYFEEVLKALQSWVNPRQTQSVNAQIYPDALLRSADCYFMQKNYQQALTRYNEVLKLNWEGSDYAYYQIGILEGLSGRNREKINNLNALIADYPNSLYIDDALYQIGITQVLDQNYEGAIKTHRKLLRNYPNSSYVPKSLVSLGLVYFNIGEYDNALKYYRQILQNHSYSGEVNGALLGAKDVFAAQGDVAGYAKFVKKYAGRDFSPSAQDTLAYEIAEEHYLNGDCDKAIPAFTNYLLTYSRGAFDLYAHFYRAQCLYSEQQYAKAGIDYDYILAQPKNLFTEQSLDKAARVAFYVSEDYEKAFSYYEQLYATTSRKELITESLRGLMNCAYFLQKAPETTKYADLLLANASASEEDFINAHFYKGVLAYQGRQFPLSVQNLTEVVNLTTNKQGAEARYYIADIKFQNRQLDQAEAWCFRVIKETASQEYWTVKAFLLLADVYLLKDDVFQAKATLRSIIDNYEKEDELKEEARAKLDQLQILEASTSKVKSDTLELEYLELDEE